MMVWLSWRQHRTELLVAAALAIGFSCGMGLLTLQLQGDEASVHRVCSATPGPICLAAGNDFAGTFSLPNFLIYDSLLVLPALAGIFIGAPLLAREFEQGTVRLIWTQGVTRIRWLATKVNLVLVSAVVMSGAIAVVAILLVDAQIQAFTSRWSSFDIQGLPFVAYVVFAIALGTAVGGLVRRVLPAMGMALALFVAVRLAVVIWLRPNFLPPLEWDISKPMTDGGDSWNVGQRVVDLSGHPVSQSQYNQLIANAGALQGSTGDYLRAHGVVVYQLYQPESRFWLFQNLEAGLFIGLAAGLIALTVWLTRRA
jgi:hypothetical protein